MISLLANEKKSASHFTEAVFFALLTYDVIN